MPGSKPIFVFLLVLLCTGSLAAQSPVIDGPPPPEFPEMLARDAAGKVTVRAIKLKQPLKVDGRLDEDVYHENQPFGGLVQVVPTVRCDAIRTDRHLDHLRHREHLCDLPLLGFRAA